MVSRKVYQVHMRAERTRALRNTTPSTVPNVKAPEVRQSKLRRLQDLGHRLKALSQALPRHPAAIFDQKRSGAPRPCVNDTQLDQQQRANFPLLHYAAQLKEIRRQIRAFSPGENHMLAPVHQDLVGRVTAAEMSFQRLLTRLARAANSWELKGTRRIIDCCASETSAF